MNLEADLISAIQIAVLELYGVSDFPVKLEITNKDFEGDYTFVVFPLLRMSKKNPEATANEIGDFITEKTDFIASFNTVKGFLNLVISTNYWLDFLEQNWSQKAYGSSAIGKGQRVMVEYSSPNTNKPLHLGHIRNILLGYSVSQMLENVGYDVIKANLINDRGIHICKSMLAWKKYGNGETPQSSGIKGDHLVGKYYVEFDRHYKAEIDDLVTGGMDKEHAEKNAPLILEAQEMLRLWEAGDPETMELWRTMNGWVYQGFDVSYKRLGVSFDKYYYESNTYTLGKNLIDEGLRNGVFFRKDDGSVWIDLTEEGLDQKLVLRSDGTSVYITQDIGTADEKFSEFQPDKSIYVVGNEQDYHFKVLFHIMKKLGRSYADGMHHLSYGMVDLPHGKMKSREGTVVDADDLMDEMIAEAKSKTIELGKIDGLSESEQEMLFENLGMAALKFFILKVDPKKRMLFNPSESIDFHGDTGPFVMYTFTRIQSVLRQAGDEWKMALTYCDLTETEKEVLRLLYRFTEEAQSAAMSYSPAQICQYLLELAKNFNRFYNESPMLKESDRTKRAARLKIAALTSSVLENGLRILGIQTVERM